MEKYWQYFINTWPNIEYTNLLLSIIYYYNLQLSLQALQRYKTQTIRKIRSCCCNQCGTAHTVILTRSSPCAVVLKSQPGDTVAVVFSCFQRLYSALHCLNDSLWFRHWLGSLWAALYVHASTEEETKDHLRGPLFLSLCTSYNNQHHVSVVTVDDNEVRKIKEDEETRARRREPENKENGTGNEERIVEERGAWSMRLKITLVAVWCLSGR